MKFRKKTRIFRVKLGKMKILLGLNRKEYRIIELKERKNFGYKNFDFFRKRILYIFNKQIGGGSKKVQENKK